jgi:hypothetical protein
VSLSDLAAIGSFISGIAVVFSFLFLALQMRQSNLNQKSLAQGARGARYVEVLSKMADPYMSKLMCRTARGDATLDASEAQSIIRTVGAMLMHYEDSYLQFRAGTLDLASWESDAASLKALLSDPGVRVSWRFVRHYLGGTYCNYVDELLCHTKLAPLADYGEQWNLWMTEEMAAR